MILASAFKFAGYEIDSRPLTIVLPVGISFYTFQTLSYSIDIYKNKIKPSRDFLAFCSFVSFFPQLVAGPIERATNLLPQFTAPRTYDYRNAVDGMRQILWGLFKKMVIADGCANVANIIFENPESYNASSLAIGAILFAFQIYGDFSGYSDIAIGTARLFGFNLMQNFSFPYFSRDIAEFWRRWHISLSTWFRDYLYIPLGGSRGSIANQLRNVFAIFLVSGFWHGANFTFIMWGALHACFFVPLLLSQTNRKHIHIVAYGKALPNPKEIVQMLATFSIVALAWVLFRSSNIDAAAVYLSRMFDTSILDKPNFPGSSAANRVYALVLLFVAAEWAGRNGRYALEHIGTKTNRVWRWVIYSSLILTIGLFMQTEETPFIYFQF